VSTSNFYSMAGTVYALDFSDDAGEYDDTIASMVMDDVSTAVIEDLQDKGYIVTAANESDGDRNYPGHIFAQVELKNSRDQLYCTAALIIRSGYYSDANLDFELTVYNGYTGEYLEVEELDDEVVAESCAETRDISRAQYNRYKNAGRVSYYSESDYTNTIRTDILPTKKQIVRIYKSIEREASELDAAIRESYEKFTTPYRRVATFSNGESIYEKIGGSNQ
jgi:hypothetical protein